jgi:hypothetical protein
LPLVKWRLIKRLKGSKLLWMKIILLKK